MKTITWDCPGCKHSSSEPIKKDRDVICPSCQKKYGRIRNDELIFDACPVCTCKQFYVQKDFNRGLGCFIVFVGILLVPKTYGLSLPVVALIDWLMYRKVPTMIICYRCGAEYRGLVPRSHFKPYRHHIAIKYDKYR